MNKANKRFRIFFFILISVTGILIIQYARIMLFTPSSSPLDTPSFPDLQRGAIYDRNGKLMAIQTRLDSVTAWVPEIIDKEKTASLLTDALDMDRDELNLKFKDPDRQGFQYIKRQITPTESKIVNEMIQSGSLPGIRLEPEMGRNYPEKDLAAHIIGYVGTDNIGLDGIEYTFNQILAPPEISTNGNKILYGNDVFLTIDLNTQYITEQIARKAMEKHKPDGLMIMVMGADTGELFSIVSLPSFNPNTFSQYSAAQRNNLPVTLTYEPGSVMKIFSIASFMELGGIRPDDIFDTRGGYNPELFQKYKIPPITDLGAYGTLDTTGILIHSSNVGTALASDTVSRQDYYNMLKNFGFGGKTGIPLPGESNGILNRPEKWSVRSKPTIAMGQEIGVSAIQMISAATVFANSGELLKPRIVSKVVAPSGEIVKEYNREAVREVLSPEVAESVLLMMEQVVASPVGTVRRAQVPGLRISGKSGTAQRIDPETGTYSDSDFMSSVLALFPTEDPKLIVYVMLQVPKGESIYGGRIASPIVKELAERLSPYYGIPIQGNTIVEHDGRIKLPAGKDIKVGTELPDFTGLSKREVMAALEGSTMPLTIKGEGWVVFQFPPAGERIDDQTTMYLEFR
ncbi:MULTISPECIES: penicillin-binding protein [unclassified Oceanispirochaeta]|uniref:penicillin-binding protein n=1 Tax=unclassified Oceanispirochaeta TaxID=2635722 RepID=UPI000E098BAE|nr:MULTISPECIES: penicillin-binding protein [unclassified Oceanispirochaeta]MBF9014767.1 transpeptidase family protein [Oceanispirochaeta sp. M2]NPD71023.1 transpeptidase family protein [Oceanispirochaeta sp. M1]RDG33856.1 PASTA domain-containing protein [Oceanispirochaeta sp. M1]